MYLDLIFKLIKYCKWRFNIEKRRVSKLTYRRMCFQKYICDAVLHKCLDNPDRDPVEIIYDESLNYWSKYIRVQSDTVKSMYAAYINALNILLIHAENKEVTIA